MRKTSWIFSKIVKKKAVKEIENKVINGVCVGNMAAGKRNTRWSTLFRHWNCYKSVQTGG
jgi:hypothetical protein